MVFAVDWQKFWEIYPTVIFAYVVWTIVFKVQARSERRGQREVEARAAREQEQKPTAVEPTNSEWLDGYLAARQEQQHERPREH
jgi:hypothetical protein